MVVWALYIERDDEWNFEHMVETNGAIKKWSMSCKEWMRNIVKMN
jgi:hypothetical protein